ncbi:hypothetical protein QWZ06_24420 [Chryseobacterium tructae]|uniref:hypothetical protein n=1 Tax=Chryseobacterium tructae TaxID=1037380 RepID=UPI0025B3C569|nr:hypothetical protein [Chryseobacterium tructae]MDN3695151.1 hypothetical protein [Chryseobacterium tructae]
MKKTALQDMIQKTWLAILLFITPILVNAQNKTYASSQITKVINTCQQCSIQAPQNVIGSNENDYTTIKVPYNSNGMVEQTLIFPTSKEAHFNKAVVGIEVENMPIHVLALGGVYIESFLGDTSNGDQIQVNQNMLKPIEGTAKGNIEFIPYKRYDRIKIYFHDVVDDSARKIYYAYQTPTPKTYATSQTNQTLGVCLLCSIKDQQNAVGSNEYDFTSIKIPVGIAGRIVQTLIYPAVTPTNFKKIVIGIGTNKDALNLQLLGGMYVETFLGNTSNNDYKKVDNSMLKLLPNSQTGSIEFTSPKRFDRVKVYFYSGLLGLDDELRIYYTYYTLGTFTTCGTLPLDPVSYYPFNGDAKDVINGLDLNEISNNTKAFPDGIICNKTITSGHLSTSVQHDSLQQSKTIAFWGRTDGTSSGVEVQAFNTITRINNEEVKSHPAAINPSKDIEELTIHSTSLLNQWNHYTITYFDTGYYTHQCLYKNGNYIGCTDPEERIPTANAQIVIRLPNNGSEIDELLFYNRILAPDEISYLAQSYNQPSTLTHPRH